MARDRFGPYLVLWDGFHGKWAIATHHEHTARVRFTSWFNSKELAEQRARELAAAAEKIGGSP